MASGHPVMQARFSIPGDRRRAAGRLGGMTDAGAAPWPPVVGPLDRPPRRHPGSVRRTSSIDMAWPDGPATATHMLGRARDLRTTTDGDIEVLAEDSMVAVVSLARTIDHIEVDPPRPGIGQLVGAGAGKGLRAAIDAAVPEDRRDHTPLALLLDDIAGASLIGAFAWSRHGGPWSDLYQSRRSGNGPAEMPRRPMVGVCSGFRPGSSALQPDGTPVPGGRSATPVGSLVDPDDPIGWHPLAELTGVSMRRARRMDVWPDGDVYRIDAYFRDTCTDPDFDQVAVHEYSVGGVVDAKNLLIRELEAVPRTLPFSECPAAAANVAWLLGRPLPDLRQGVLEVLRGVDCCTHLNDALRALADVAALLPLAGVGPTS